MRKTQCPKSAGLGLRRECRTGIRPKPGFSPIIRYKLVDKPAPAAG